MTCLKKVSLFSLSIILVCLGSCAKKVSVKIVDKNLYPITPTLPQDSSILAFYKPYKLQIDSQMNTVIGWAENDIKAAKPEGALNNLMVDAMAKAAAKRGIAFDLVHTNYKSLRVPILKGNIKRFKIFELMPFENLLVTVKMSGLQVKELFDYIGDQGGDPIAGARFDISGGKAENILINDKPLNPSTVYTILTSDYVANGGDGALMYSKATDRKEFPVKVREALLEYIGEETKAGRMVKPKIEGRIRVGKKQGNE
ncbi:5'-nucleotidase C-terminal domain-containing protein [Desertivirga arenae]|uniref:5'-nucleotidase C-terminal domain-containing protein n=1 Tax=Desertivirga arenae TaxID=2810309 RepID=UPI001A97AC99|nr:5'-nucleotidase C-terminal domain-containing protein [Pedobacter sp. SYSU D00823]